MILDSATDSVSESEFTRPDEVYQALMAIRDVGTLYFDSIRNRTSMGTWAEQLGTRGFTQYSQTESDTVKNDYRKYGRYREFVLNGSKGRSISIWTSGAATARTAFRFTLRPTGTWAESSSLIVGNIFLILAKGPSRMDKRQARWILGATI